MFTGIDISTSGMIAQRTRLTTVAANIANMSTMRNEQGELEPYQARYVVFAADPKNGNAADGAAGVKVESIRSEEVEPIYKYDPDHPLAIKEGPHQGCVAQPRVDMTLQFVDALEATRAYEANIGAMELSKSMYEDTLRILG